MTEGFLKLVKSDRSDRLKKDPNAFMILMEVALRANRSEQINDDGFAQFQAGIGKNDFPWMTENEYRRAKQRITRHRFAQCEAQGRGTLVTLLDSTVWNINPEGQEQDKNRVVQYEAQGDATRGTPNKNKEKEVRKEIKHIVEFLNKTCKTTFKHTTPKTQQLINGRLNDGYTLEDFQKVITVKNSEWAHTDRSQYLRPQTLFTPTNFEAYLNQKEGAIEDVDTLLENNRKRLREAGYRV